MSFDKLESRIGLTFANRNLLTEAFTHGIIRGKAQSKDSETYRRLEFLGNAVLRLAVSESVFRDSDGNVERLHDTREKFISNHSLARAAEELGLSNYLRDSGSGNVRTSQLVLRQLDESRTAAICVDRGLRASFQVCGRNPDQRTARPETRKPSPTSM